MVLYRIECLDISTCLQQNVGNSNIYNLESSIQQQFRFFSLLLRCKNFYKSKYKLPSSRFVFSAFRCIILSLQLEFGEARPLQIEVIS